MNNFLILANDDKDVGLVLSNKILKYITENGAQARIVSDIVNDYDGSIIKEDYIKGAQAVIVLGGDGTMLRAAAAIGSHNIPLMGINLGTLGFLTEIEEKYAFMAIDRLISDDFKIEKRMMIEGMVNNQKLNSLNDIVITRAGFSRIIGLNVYVNDELLDTYEADGVIVATPTGTTGYNLSAGGPIVSPKSKAIVVTPISPHSLTTKSIVFDDTDRIKIEIVKKRKTQETEAIISFDGCNNMELSAGDIIEVEKSAKEISIIKMYDVNFYKVLRDKLGGTSI